jgi:hypothetical protein
VRFPNNGSRYLEGPHLQSAQAGFAEILSKRLRPPGGRVMTLYPPDFNNAAGPWSRYAPGNDTR